jgi:hypothetical protein
MDTSFDGSEKNDELLSVLVLRLGYFIKIPVADKPVSQDLAAGGHNSQRMRDII